MDRGFGTVDVQGPWRQKLLSPLPSPVLVTNVFGLQPLCLFHSLAVMRKHSWVQASRWIIDSKGLFGGRGTCAQGPGAWVGPGTKAYLQPALFCLWLRGPGLQSPEWCSVVWPEPRGGDAIAASPLSPQPLPLTCHPLCATARALQKPGHQSHFRKDKAVP